MPNFADVLDRLVPPGVVPSQIQFRPGHKTSNPGAGRGDNRQPPHVPAHLARRGRPLRHGSGPGMRGDTLPVPFLIMCLLRRLRPSRPSRRVLNEGV